MSLKKKLIGGLFISQPITDSFIVLFIFSMILLSIFKFNIHSRIMGIFYITITLIIAIASFIFGYYSTKKKNIFYEIFYPNKYNLSISAILTFIILFILVLTGTNYQIQHIIDLLKLFLIIIFKCYSFSALIYYLYLKKKSKLKFPLWIIILIIILNPIFVLISSAFALDYSYSLSHQPCGLRIHDFNEISPARDAGMNIGEVILQINDINITDFNTLFSVISDSDNFIYIKTEDNLYEVELIYDPETNRKVMGVNISQEYCNKAIFDYLFNK